ncbi:LacI family DNA-binding transcriptional regulator [Glycomyces terrestris]|uniref:LacI family transcriptional regulator n=1 Tax=Glycomyces terrestris TaxID=2493553 RepID=A0A426UVH7_9ACTN|nr:LacI family DNA-binding transcriptional regulator [Glycomyces terrestris]RRR98201.1 LacI family transcriptional regulator [Glycomyces terrestris]
MSERRARRTAPTSHDVARLAGVSQSTVSYVMSGKRSISAETRERVMAAIEQLTYQPNAGARALRGRTTHVIALMVRLGERADPRDTVPYIDTIVEAARERDYDVVLITTDEGPDGLKRMAGRQNCDAFILMDVAARDERIATAAALDLPVVLIGTPADRAGLDAVDYDAVAAAEALVDELADTGHTHAVVLGETGGVVPGEYWFLSAFHDACRDRAAARGLAFDAVHPDRPGWAGVDAAAPRLLAHRGERLGLIARTPQAAEWLLQLTRLHGLRPGADVSVVGVCSDAAAAAFDPPVTNVSAQARDVSRKAVDLLFERLGGSETEPGLHLIAPGELHRRATTAVFS